MGYSTIMFGVDLEQIRAAIADQDLAAVAAAREEDPEEFDSTLDDGEPTVGEALRALILGEALAPEHAHQSGYALKLWCATIGEWLPDDDMLGDLEPLELQSPRSMQRTPTSRATSTASRWPIGPCASAADSRGLPSAPHGLAP